MNGAKLTLSAASSVGILLTAGLRLKRGLRDCLQSDQQ
jgi:hypothetical protein